MHDTQIECEPLLLLESLQATPASAVISDFFMNWVHDSMAGFIGDGVSEYKINGFGIAKFRRIYAGNNGDGYLRKQVKKRNAEKIAAAKALRAQAAQWALETREYQRTR